MALFLASKLEWDFLACQDCKPQKSGICEILSLCLTVAGSKFWSFCRHVDKNGRIQGIIKSMNVETFSP